MSLHLMDEILHDAIDLYGGFPKLGGTLLGSP